MENKQPLLSICIPTYNRAEYLVGALENITSDPAFDERVEIVISDNASTDDTQKIVKAYILQYNNIVYYRNEENIKDKNFILALQRGHGKYIRLFNDTLRFKNGALEKMLYIINSTTEDKVLFFFQNIDFIKEKNCSVIAHDINSFLSFTSYYTTWIANFGCWRKNLLDIMEYNRYSDLQLAQVDWFLQLATSKKSFIYFGDFFDSVVPNKKGGYNLFQVFVNNYLFILKQHNISFKFYQIEKYRLFRYFILPWLSRISDTEKFSFQSKHKWSILLKNYFWNPYFYIGMLVFYIKNILNKNI